MNKLTGNEYYILQKAAKNEAFFIKVNRRNKFNRMSEALGFLYSMDYVKKPCYSSATAKITNKGKAELKAAQQYMIG